MDSPSTEKPRRGASRKEPRKWIQAYRRYAVVRLEEELEKREHERDVVAKKISELTPPRVGVRVRVSGSLKKAHEELRNIEKEIVNLKEKLSWEEEKLNEKDFEDYQSIFGADNIGTLEYYNEEGRGEERKLLADKFNQVQESREKQEEKKAQAQLKRVATLAAKKVEKAASEKPGSKHKAKSRSELMKMLTKPKRNWSAICKSESILNLDGKT